jgi:CheY-like chemotaxis protein
MIAKPKLKILLVDDNPIFIKLFSKLLQTSFDELIERVDSAENGQDCIDKVQKFSYDVVFMDLEMPVLSGAEATKYITENFRNIKVVAVSLHSELGSIQKMLESGAKNYIIKEKISKEYIGGLLAKF